MKRKIAVLCCCVVLLSGLPVQAEELGENHPDEEQYTYDNIILEDQNDLHQDEINFEDVETTEDYSEEKKEDPFVQGMEKVYKQLMTTLDGIGVKPIEAVGKEFNPDFHNAVMHVEDEELGENIIAEEFQKGYMYHDSVVRHSMVKVAN